MYHVLLNTDNGRNFSMSVRDLEKSPHWKQIGENVFRDSRESIVKPFVCVAQFQTEKEAREFAVGIKLVYKGTNFTETDVKVG